MADDRKNIRTIDLPAREVTLLEDRARVLRRAIVELPAGVSRVRVADVAPVLSDKTLSGEVRAESGDASGRVADVRVIREYIVGRDESTNRDAEAAVLDAELKQLDARIETLETERLITERHATGLDRLASSTMAELSEDVSWGREADDSWSEQLSTLSAAERELRERLVDIASEIDDLHRKRGHLDARIVKTQNPLEREWAGLEADIVVEAAGAYTLTLEYMVPNACWRPYHTAKLITAPDRTRVSFATDACVWQNTGEDWRDVQLILSTERASLGTQAPPLSSDILSVQRKSDTVVVEAREQEIQNLGPGGDHTTVSADLPGIDDGGVTLHLRAPKPSTVPSDGKPYRVHLTSFDTDADVALIGMPEMMNAVLTKSVQANAGIGPILAGPVDLIRDSGLIGRTSVLFIAAGERFELGWGPEADLRIKRDTEITEEKSRLLSSWTERIHEIEIRLSNLGDRTHEIKVTERIPVSEIDKVKITLNTAETTDNQDSDDNGFIQWDVTVGPGQNKRLQLSYKLERHDDVSGI